MTTLFYGQITSYAANVI